MKHIVLIKLKERTSQNQKRVMDILRKMDQETIPYVCLLYTSDAADEQ